jgi:FMN phosphatase YigB (HAD superfamily)
MPKKLVMLDLEGVQVFKDRQLHAGICSQLLEERGFPVTKDQFYQAFRQCYIPYSLGKYSSDSQFYTHVFNQLDIPFDISLAKELHQLYLQSFGQYPQIPAIITKLRRHYPLFLLSNHINHWVDFLLKKFNLKGIFTYQIISQSAGVRKPDPEIFYKALELAAVTPETCVFFDDKKENVRAAAHLGIEARGVDPSIGLTLDQVRDLIEK